jgi:hypothetical protein
MIPILSQEALILCAHKLGRVSLDASQTFVRVIGVPLLVENDPEARSIVGCPNVAPGVVPCLHTLPVKKGYSEFVRIAGRALCLQTVSGLTDGVPPGTFSYTVKNPGQTLLRSSG